MILGIEYEASRRQADGAKALMDKLEEARSCAVQQRGRADMVAWLAKQICTLQVEHQDAEAVVSAYRRQQGDRDATRQVTALMQSRTRDRFTEQLMLSPRRAQFGVL